MENIQISDILLNENSLEKIESYLFKMDSKGPKYKIVFGRKYESPLVSINNNDFNFRIVGSEKDISDDKSKLNLLNKLYTNVNSSTNH
jgi:hypothetical protein